MAGRYGSALLALSLLSGCSAEPEPAERRAIRAYLPPYCGEARPEDLEVELAALGDFDPGPNTRELLRGDARGRVLVIPNDTLALEASDPSAGFHGYAERRSDDGFDVLLWPVAASCPLTGGSSYPAPGGGQAVGVAALQPLSLIAGGDSRQSAEASGALVVDLATGEARLVDPEAGLLNHRAYATVTPFGSDLLVAGGFDPVRDTPPAEALLGSAQVFDTQSRKFAPSLIEPLEPRAFHAAVALDGGDTLLVGGLGPSADALRTLQVVSPRTGRARLAGLATLGVGRIDPVALRLDDGRVLVAGGRRADGSPVGTLEWLTPDASELAHAPVELPPRNDRAFVAMPGGALLAVGGCEERAPDAGEDCSLCRRGCPPRDGWDAWWLSPEAVASELPPLPVAAPRPRLIRGLDGAPWLVASGLLFAFDPWSGRFAPVPSEATLPSPAARHVAIDSGAMIWVDADGSVVGMRHSTRSRFAQDLALLQLTREDNPGSPRFLAPDRSPLASASGGPGARYLGAEGLELGYGTVWIGDARYRTLRVELELAAGPAPVVALGTRRVGSFECPWPEPAGAYPETLVVERRGDVARLLRGGRSVDCRIEPDWIAVGLISGGDPPTRITNLDVSRELD